MNKIYRLILGGHFIIQGSFTATFSGTKNDILRLINFVEEKYPELISLVYYPCGFENICSASPQLSMEAYIDLCCDGDPMDRYTSAPGSTKLIEEEGVACLGCGKFISMDDFEFYD